MSLFSKIFGNRKPSTPVYESDDLTINGESLRLTFFAHASLAIEYKGRNIYVDPVTGHAEYEHLPKADMILVTHSHYDHFDRAAIEVLQTAETRVLCDKSSAEGFAGDCYTMLPGAVAEPFDDIRVEAVAAYNTSEHQLQFHPKEREDCGYVVTLGGNVRIYISGDTEPTDELRALKDIDIAFMCVNQPYTMTPDEAVEAVEAIRPKIYYPYHYGQVDEPTDVEALAERLKGVCDVRIRPLA
ncbi:MAG: MBL fold metallo-hydrolase [Alistipes sp.]|nr:MBL fold metallo-hydrolase [Alistipes sp.]